MLGEWTTGWFATLVLLWTASKRQVTQVTNSGQVRAQYSRSWIWRTVEILYLHRLSHSIAIDSGRQRPSDFNKGGPDVSLSRASPILQRRNPKSSLRNDPEGLHIIQIIYFVEFLFQRPLCARHHQMVTLMSGNDPQYSATCLHAGSLFSPLILLSLRCLYLYIKLVDFPELTTVACSNCMKLPHLSIYTWNNHILVVSQSRKQSTCLFVLLKSSSRWFLMSFLFISCMGAVSPANTILWDALLKFSNIKIWEVGIRLSANAFVHWFIMFVFLDDLLLYHLDLLSEWVDPSKTHRFISFEISSLFLSLNRGQGVNWCLVSLHSESGLVPYPHGNTTYWYLWGIQQIRIYCVNFCSIHSLPNITLPYSRGVGHFTFY